MLAHDFLCILQYQMPLSKKILVVSTIIKEKEQLHWLKSFANSARLYHFDEEKRTYKLLCNAVNLAKILKLA